MYIFTRFIFIIMVTLAHFLLVSFWFFDVFYLDYVLMYVQHIFCRCFMEYNIYDKM